MADKTFNVVRPLSGTSRIITGKSLKGALKKYGLDPTTWKEVELNPESEVIEFDDNQGDGGQ